MNNPRKLQRIVGAIFLIAVGILVVGPFILTSDDNRRVTVADGESNRPNEAPVSVLSTLSDEAESASNINLDERDSIHNQPYQPGGELSSSPVPEDLWADLESGQMAQSSSDDIQALYSPHNSGNSRESTSYDRSQQGNASSSTGTTSGSNVSDNRPPALPSLNLASSSSHTTSNTAATSHREEKSSNQYQWFVQVGVFQNSNNAQQQYQKFSAAGYPVYIEQEGNLNKVRLGPYKSRDNATRVQNNLKAAGIPTSLVPPRS